MNNLSVQRLMDLPAENIEKNTLEFEQNALVKQTGFREYDARWMFEKEINLKGVQAVGNGFGRLMLKRGVRPDVVVGHDYRSYSSAIKYAFITGLLASGCRVHDIGLCTTPMAYFSQFQLDVPAVAMVTASHNENGWTGIKMGIDRPLTLGPEDMRDLKTIVMNSEGSTNVGGTLTNIAGTFEKYSKHLTAGDKLKRKLRVAAVCGNGTAGAFAPYILRDIGCEVIEVDCRLDFNFPRYNPNPEDMKMLEVMQKAVTEHSLDVAFGFDGDGDRCGIVNNEAAVIFSDKIGLMMARDMAALIPAARFVVDVKSTGLYAIDPVLKEFGATVDYYKTGHSYIKHRTQELDAVAGFEKSGHFFFCQPFGLGYDDGIATAIAVCRMLDRSPTQSLADLYRQLPFSVTSPTMSAHCDDEKKYDVVERITQKISNAFNRSEKIGEFSVAEVNLVNGVRFTMKNGSWGLIRASSNKPEIVVVCESMHSEHEMKAVFSAIKALLDEEPDVGAFNQVV